MNDYTKRKLAAVLLGTYAAALAVVGVLIPELGKWLLVIAFALVIVASIVWAHDQL